MKRAVEYVEAAHPNVIDINYGCPVKKVVNKEAGSGILKNIPKMVEMTREIVKSTNLPVTIKTRLGWDDDTKYIVDVAEQLQDVGIQGISIHGRTRKQMYKGDADWSMIAEVKNNPRMHIPVFGNGDVTSPEIALEKKNKYGVDGIMIGRAAIGNPWFFNQVKHFLKTGEHLALPTLAERVAATREHLLRSVEWKGEVVAILEMRRHYANYFKGMPHFKEHRMKLVTCFDYQEQLDYLDFILEKYSSFEWKNRME
jgi:tRNA-dihydrouridine synthase B